MAEFTPGPWRWFSSSSIVSGKRVEKQDHGERMRFLIGADDQGFAHTVGLQSGVDEANANLIASAPDLLAACQTLIKYCSRRDGSLANYGDWLQCFIEDGSTITEAVERAAAAI